MISINVTDREGQTHTVEGQPNDKLMEVLREFDWGVAAICGGMCSCATCHIFVEDEWLETFPQREMDEEELLEFLDHFKPNSRLSCQLELREKHDGLKVTLAPEE
ncbi:2Fe-2S iron-sulfur cluster-binding protein [Elongatibacter sediminis]|uniref:2Fe-2S iron-sulfur cluster-binding protein n=1 Tax=Elongatibacter sediminis TaxID=3119006 RepID=A0AAW9RIN6_9GAMM